MCPSCISIYESLTMKRYFVTWALLLLTSTMAWGQEARVLYDAQRFSNLTAGALDGQEGWQTNVDTGAGVLLIDTASQSTLASQAGAYTRALVSADISKLAAAWRDVEGTTTQDHVRLNLVVLLPDGRSGGLRRLNMAVLEGQQNSRACQPITLEIIRIGTQANALYSVRSYLPHEKRTVEHARVAGGQSVSITMDVDYKTHRFKVVVEGEQVDTLATDALSWVSDPDQSIGRFRGFYAVFLGEQRYNIRADMALADVKIQTIATR